MCADLCRTCGLRIGRDIRLAEIVTMLLQILISKFLVNIVCRILLVRLKGQLRGSTVSGKYSTSCIIGIALTVYLVTHRLQLL